MATSTRLIRQKISGSVTASTSASSTCSPGAIAKRSPAASLPHPEDGSALVDRLSHAWRDGEKALVFCAARTVGRRTQGAS